MYSSKELIFFFYLTLWVLASHQLGQTQTTDTLSWESAQNQFYIHLYHLNVSVSFEGVPSHLHSPEKCSFVYFFLLWREKIGHFYGIRRADGRGREGGCRKEHGALLLFLVLLS